VHYYNQHETVAISDLRLTFSPSIAPLIFYMVPEQG
jgi:hypothetical protein